MNIAVKTMKMIINDKEVTNIPLISYQVLNPSEPGGA